MAQKGEGRGERYQAGGVNPGGVEEPVNLNEANREELKSVMGLGDETADEIIAYREREGRFESVEDLKKVPIITDNEFEKVKAHFTV